MRREDVSRETQRPPELPPAAAEGVHGDRPRGYADLLAGPGVERGPRVKWADLGAAYSEQRGGGEIVERTPASWTSEASRAAGLPVAIARPDVAVTLVEPMLRRSAFLVEAVQTLGLDVVVVRARAEDRAVVTELGSADAVIPGRRRPPQGRAVELAAAAPGGRDFALKGAGRGRGGGVQAGIGAVRRGRGWW